MQKSELKAIVFGATGAVGKTLVGLLAQSNYWSKVLAIVRKEPQEWAKYKNKGKLLIQTQPDMDKLFKTQQWKLQGYDAMFVCFGSQTKHGEGTFVKVDKTYPLLCADIAINNKIPHYLLLSSGGGDPNSMMLYLRTKGEVERDIKLKKLNKLTILQPGVITNRPDERFVQKILSFLPIPKIDCADLALSMKTLAETRAKQNQNTASLFIIQNKDILTFLNKYKAKGDKKQEM